MKKLQDYTPKEIERLNVVQELLTDYNSRVARDHSEIYNKPILTDEEVEANSQYRQLLMEKEADENPIEL